MSSLFYGSRRPADLSLRRDTVDLVAVRPELVGEKPGVALLLESVVNDRGDGGFSVAQVGDGALEGVGGARFLGPIERSADRKAHFAALAAKSVRARRVRKQAGGSR